MPGSLPGIDDGGGEIAFHFGQAFTLQEAADRLGISLRQAEMHVADGSLGAINVGRGRQRRDLRILDDELERFVSSRRVAPCRLPAPPRRSASLGRATPAKEIGSFARAYFDRSTRGGN